MKKIKLIILLLLLNLCCLTSCKKQTIDDLEKAIENFNLSENYTILVELESKTIDSKGYIELTRDHDNFLLSFNLEDEGESYIGKQFGLKKGDLIEVYELDENSNEWSHYDTVDYAFFEHEALGLDQFSDLAPDMQLELYTFKNGRFVCNLEKLNIITAEYIKKVLEEEYGDYFDEEMKIPTMKYTKLNIKLRKKELYKIELSYTVKDVDDTGMTYEANYVYTFSKIGSTKVDNPLSE